MPHFCCHLEHGQLSLLCVQIYRVWGYSTKGASCQLKSAASQIFLCMQETQRQTNGDAITYDQWPEAYVDGEQIAYWQTINLRPWQTINLRSTWQIAYWRQSTLRQIAYWRQSTLKSLLWDILTWVHPRLPGLTLYQCHHLGLTKFSKLIMSEGYQQASQLTQCFSIALFVDLSGLTGPITCWSQNLYKECYSPLKIPTFYKCLD